MELIESFWFVYICHQGLWSNIWLIIVIVGILVLLEAVVHSCGLIWESGQSTAFLIFGRDSFPS